MLRLCFRTRRSNQLLRFRPFTSSSSSSPSPSFSSSSQNHVEPSNNLKNSEESLAQPLPILHRHTPSPLFPIHKTTSLSRMSILALSATIVSALVASISLFSSYRDHDPENPSPLYDGIEQVIHKSSEPCKKLFHHVKQTGIAASVLWKSLSSVLSSANHEVRSGFELRVAALLADIAAANSSRRAAIVGAGGGAVVDWLLESVAVPRDGGGTQAEAARALAYLIADPNVSAAVLERPHAVPSLLRFIFSCHPQRSKKQPRRSSLDISDSLKGRSMLVAAIMDIVTSSCDRLDRVSFEPSLPANAETRDIAAAIQVIEEGSLHLDDSHVDEDGDSGIEGIGMKVLGGTTVLGLSRTTGSMKLAYCDGSPVESVRQNPITFFSQNRHDSSLELVNMSSAVVPGLWDDLHCEHVAVPFASWALANWAMASEENRSHIQELDQDGHAVMTALMARERSVKWHASLVAKLLLEDHNLPLSDSVSDWSSSLLSTIAQASQNEDIPLAQVALSAFLVCVERCPQAQKTVMEMGLHMMRDAARRTPKHKQVQEALAKALELLCSGDLHLSLEESQKWSGVLFQWIFGKYSSETLQSSAKNILAHILDDHGPSSIPISQAWLALLLTEILSSIKKSSVKGGPPPKSDKVKTQIDQSNIASAGQVANQLAGAVINLARTQFRCVPESLDKSPLGDLLSLELFMGPLKTVKDNIPKLDAADSAMATLKGIKALTEVCAEDSLCQNKIIDFGVLHLLRCFLLSDDYEKLAAIQTYDASRTLEAQEHASSLPAGSSNSKTNNPASIRVPPTAHIRRHAARLLTILSLHPKVQKVVVGDKELCEWLEDCARGKIPGCNDLKLQSYARATLLNIFCNEKIDAHSESNDSDTDSPNGKKTCPRYDDMIFLISPELTHWKCPEKKVQETPKGENSVTVSSSVDKDGRSPTRLSDNGNLHNLIDVPHNDSQPENTLLDVVFVHGLQGGPYKSWRIAESSSSTKSGLIEKIDEEAGKEGTFWPGEWLSTDFPQARMFTLKYKTNLTQWSGASLPLQEVSSMLLDKLIAAGIGDRPVVFVTHSMGGLVVKQMLYKAKAENIGALVNNTIGIVFYSCPHFGSKLADMPLRLGLVLRPAPSIGELRSGSSRLVELNDLIRNLHKRELLDVLSYCETKVTPIVEGYGGWAFRVEIVPIESAYPGFGELVVLESTDHVNSCKPVSRDDPSYKETLDFLRKLKALHT